MYDRSTARSNIFVSNNLTATNPYSDATQYASFAYEVVPISLAATVTGTAYEAGDGFDTVPCNNSSGTEIASVTPVGSIDTTAWTQQFTIHGVASETCSLTVIDDASAVPSNALTVTVP